MEKYYSQNQFGIFSKTPNSYCVVYSSGLQVTVELGTGGILQAQVRVPQSFYYRTLGLLGLWSNSKLDDFLYANGYNLDYKDGSFPTEEKLYDFGLSWIVPHPESFLLSQESVEQWKAFRPVFTSELLSSATVLQLNNANETCSGNVQCIHDILATNITALGLQTLRYCKNYKKLIVDIGNIPPTLTGPSKLQVKMNTTTRIEFTAIDANNDTIIFSLVNPIPKGASIRSKDGWLTWTPQSLEPVMLTVQVNDQQSGSILALVVQLCNCANGGTCDYNISIENYLNGKFQVVGCICSEGFSGVFCSELADPCKGQPCFPGVPCIKQTQSQHFTCGKCPPGTVANGPEGQKCFYNDLCLPPFPFPCHEMAECTTIDYGFNYTCKCKPGFTGDGLNCTDVDECQGLSACPNAKYECINTIGSVACKCRYSSGDSSNCDNSPNPPGCNIFNCTLKWQSLSQPKKLHVPKSTLYKAYEKTYTDKLQQILENGFEEKFYNVTLKSFRNGEPFAEYRINVSTDTPAWFVEDYLKQIWKPYEIERSTISVEDLDECASKEAKCSEAALCENTYGGYKCVCNTSINMESQSCSSAYKSGNNSVAGILSESDEQTELIKKLVLGIGIPLLLLLLLLLLACFYYMRKKTVKAELASTSIDYTIEEYSSSPFHSLHVPIVYKVHSLPPRPY
nr:PREDICTED: mucin-like protein [Latimeria chalumnae]|eukprot:XP_014348451.1 PREDICTED: mucin-like protein [Latimeria chalumnae]